MRFLIQPCPTKCILISCRRSFSFPAINRFRFDHDRLLSQPSASTSIVPAVAANPASSLSELFRLPFVYARLCKAKLSGLVVTTTLAGYLIAPGSTANSPGVLAATLLGTALCAGAANAWNQWAEVQHDARMTRTRLRPLPTKQISSGHAFGWASVCATSGISLLYFGGPGPLAAGLAATTIGLYNLVYTPMKRWSVGNTWVGAVVGGIPPLIGYAGALGPAASLHSLWPNAAILGLVLYCWQFPHFNALSYNLSQDYRRAGYCMAAIHRPALNKAAALIHAAALIPLTVALSPVGTGMVSWWFMLDSGVLAAWMTYLAARFYWKPGKSTARKLFFGSLVYLPAFLTCLVIHSI